MKRGESGFALIACCCMSVMISASFLSPDAFASNGVGPGRKLWDEIMLWVNFGIIAFLFVRYAKKPFVNYLRGAREEVRHRLETVSGQLKDAESVAAVETDNLTCAKERIKEIEESFVQRGRKEKAKIIEEAKVVADKMIRDAEAYSRYRMTMAKGKLSAEMAEMAISIAKERLSKEMSEQDHDRLIERFLGGLKTETRPGD